MKEIENLIKCWEKEIVSIRAVHKVSMPVNYDKGKLEGSIDTILSCINDLKKLNEGIVNEAPRKICECKEPKIELSGSHWKCLKCQLPPN